jgi:hypothetical protein
MTHSVVCRETHSPIYAGWQCDPFRAYCSFAFPRRCWNGKSLAIGISPVREPNPILVQFSFQFLIGSFVSCAVGDCRSNGLIVCISGKSLDPSLKSLETPSSTVESPPSESPSNCHMLRSGCRFIRKHWRRSLSPPLRLSRLRRRLTKDRAVRSRSLSVMTVFNLSATMRRKPGNVSTTTTIWHTYPVPVTESTDSSEEAVSKRPRT